MTKSTFLKYYETYCVPVLTAIAAEWLEQYGGDVAYRDFYVEKFYQAAAVILFGENEPNQLNAITKSKPDVEIRFFYDNDSWDEIGQMRV